MCKSYGTKAYFNTRTGNGVECGGGAAKADCLCAPPNTDANADADADDGHVKIHLIGQMELMDATPMNVMMVGVTLMVVIVT